MLYAFALAFRQLGDRRFLVVFVKSLAVTLAVFAVLGAGLYRLLGRYLAGGGWAVLVTMLIEVVLVWTLFRAVAIAVTGLFGDQVVQAVEAQYYPQALATARPVSFARSLGMGLKSSGRLLGYNLVASPLYIALLATGVGLPIAFFALNGWLLGRDLGDMVAVRHLEGPALGEWRGRTRWRRATTGVASAGLFAVPVVNLIAPMVGAAAMTHLFHQRRPS